MCVRDAAFRVFRSHHFPLVPSYSMEHARVQATIGPAWIHRPAATAWDVVNFELSSALAHKIGPQ